MQQTDYQAIELKHIYRQSDPEFIALLNQVRDNRLTRESLRTLNSRYVPAFQPQSDQSYFTLTTTNAAAQEINASNLKRLSGKPEKFSAKIQGSFPESFYPTEVELEFKSGAQVMFIKNDPERRYYNGKIGQIVSLDSESIQVACPGDLAKIDVTPVEWKSILGRQENGDRRMDRWFNDRANTAFNGFDTWDQMLAWVHYRSILLSPFSCQHQPRLPTRQKFEDEHLTTSFKRCKL